MPSEERERQLSGTFLRAWNHPPISSTLCLTKNCCPSSPFQVLPTTLQWLQVKKPAGPNSRTSNKRISRSMENWISHDHHLQTELPPKHTHVFSKCFILEAHLHVLFHNLLKKYLFSNTCSCHFCFRKGDLGTEDDRMLDLELSLKSDRTKNSTQIPLL